MVWGCFFLGYQYGNSSSSQMPRYLQEVTRWVPSSVNTVQLVCNERERVKTIILVFVEFKTSLKPLQWVKGSLMMSQEVQLPQVYLLLCTKQNFRFKWATLDVSVHKDGTIKSQKVIWRLTSWRWHNLKCLLLQSFIFSSVIDYWLRAKPAIVRLNITFLQAALSALASCC